MKFAVIMAAGKGTRMKSELPKVLHKVLDDAMAQVILNNVKKAGAERTVAIVGYGHELVEKALEGQCEFAVQEPQLGTGHAVMQAKQLEGEKGLTLVVNGDCPCVRSETYSELYKAVEDADMAVLTVVPEDAASYGRVIRNADGTVEKIVEFKDATPEEREVREVNTGIYAFNNEALFEGLKLLKNDNAQHEYYITDLVEILKGLGKTVKAVKAEDWLEVQGVNDNVELARATAYLRKRINTAWMKEGVTIVDPENTFIGPEVTFGHDVTVWPNTYLFGKTEVADGAVVRPGTWVRDGKILPEE
ncbi:MAG TPA: UDP-N-acetylglucosamine diphosphorylase [Erysipelotrichaceae bacterium]|nr:UDP-N-acetylglucosamine diphosphorylase [Erysipelotrichaceae bacterium]